MATSWIDSLLSASELVEEKYRNQAKVEVPAAPAVTVTTAVVQGGVPGYAMAASLVDESKTNVNLEGRVARLKNLYPQGWLDTAKAKAKGGKGAKGTKAALLNTFTTSLMHLEEYKTYAEVKAYLRTMTDGKEFNFRCPLTDPSSHGQCTTFDLLDFCADECRFTKENAPSFNGHELERKRLNEFTQYVCTEQGCKDDMPLFPTVTALKEHHQAVHNQNSKFVPRIKCPVPTCDHAFRVEGRPNRMSEHFDEQHSFAPAFMCAHPGCYRIFWRRGKAEEHTSKAHTSGEADGRLNILSIERWDVFLLFLGEYSWAKDMCAEFLRSPYAETMVRSTSKRAKLSDGSGAHATTASTRSTSTTSRRAALQARQATAAAEAQPVKTSARRMAALAAASAQVDTPTHSGQLPTSGTKASLDGSAITSSPATSSSNSLSPTKKMTRALTQASKGTASPGKWI